MEGCSSRKRKLCCDDHHEEEEDNDEEKMEKFFALVKSIREARDRLNLKTTSYSTKELDEKRMIKRKLEEKKPVEVEVWKPTFQREDFLETHDVHLHHQQYFITNPPASQVGSSETRQGADQKEENKQEAIDLRLSL